MNIVANNMGKIIAILILNIPIGLVFMYLSPICSQYLKGDYASFASIAFLALRLPMYWILGAIIFPFIILLFITTLLSNMALLAKMSLEEFIVFGYIFLTFGLLSHLLIYWQKLTSRIRILEVMILSALLNILFLQSFFISMSA